MNNDLSLSQQIEDLLVARNPRGMRTVQSALTTGYCLRSAQMIAQCSGNVLIATGFPVNGTYETDGPLGAVALYKVLSEFGANPIFICGEPLASAVKGEYQVCSMPVGFSPQGETCVEHQVHEILETYRPSLIITIELPGRANDGFYYNMRGVDISHQVIGFDDALSLADCPSISIGDGGNEVGMGNISERLSGLDIIPCATVCDELVIADVSNWAAHGIIAMLSKLMKKDFLGDWNNQQYLKYFAERGGVDGVTGEKTLTEDGLACEVTDSVISQLRHLCGFS